MVDFHRPGHTFAVQQNLSNSTLSMEMVSNLQNCWIMQGDFTHEIAGWDSEITEAY